MGYRLQWPNTHTLPARSESTLTACLPARLPSHNTSHPACLQWPNTHTANGGFIYIQNAHPSGPSVWIFLEATDRLLRHSADNWAWMQARGLKKQCKHMDQVGSGSTLSRLMPSQWACSYAALLAPTFHPALTRLPSIINI